MSLKKIKQINDNFGGSPERDKYYKEYVQMLDYLGMGGAWKRKALDEFTSNSGGLVYMIMGKLWNKIKQLENINTEEN